MRLNLAVIGAAAAAALVSVAVILRPGAGAPLAGVSHVLAGPGIADSEISNPSGIGSVRYGRDVRPILSDRCFLCHGPDREKQQADLRLDVREGAVAARGDHGPAIVPGDPGASELWRRIESHDPEEVMPPADSTKKPLSAEERAIVRRWIEEGAEYEPHWAFEAPARPALPAVGEESWCRNPIDRFVLRRLDDAGLAPSPEADAEVLIRRVFLDLTGLPPTPGEAEAYLADGRPDRYERLVDRLLTEEPYRTRYAERMATPWLDQARYADTSGIHMDAGRSAWPWRDWVLEAYRTNMPFDEFAIEQLAGDLLPGATQAQRIASGFHRNHVTSDEGGAIDEEYRVEYAADRVETTGSVFLGLTVACARCHDHKFDPITQDDYYSMFAFFNSNEEPGIYSQSQDANRAHEPFMAAPSESQAAAMAGLRARLSAIEAERDAPSPEEDAQREAFLAGLAGRTAVVWATPGDGAEVAGASSAAGSTVSVQPDGSVLSSGENPDDDVVTIELETGATGLRLLALEALPDATLPFGRVGRAPNGNAVLGSIEAEAVSVADPGQRQTVRFVWAWADVEQRDGDYRVTNALDPSGMRGWAVGGHFDRDGEPLGRTAVFLAEEPFGFAGGTRVIVRLRYDSVYAQHAFGRVRLSLGTVGEQGLAVLPVAGGGFYRMGPFRAGDTASLFDTAFGPESAPAFVLADQVDGQAWRHDPNIDEGRPAPLSNDPGVEYVAREVFAPSDREIELSLGSDDGIRVFVNGEEAFANRIDRGVAPDQDRATVRLRRGVNTVVYKIVNTGGPSGVYTRSIEPGEVLAHDIVPAVLAPAAQRPELMSRAVDAWRTRFSPRYRELSEQITAMGAEIAVLEAQIPRAMVMKEMAEERETFVLARGQYDHPDRERPVERGPPAALGTLPEGSPRNRLGLAQWMMSDENPLVARVTVNRQWELLFGTGIVRTTGDFGYQGEWPSHPELLDWLAVEFRESGWDVRHMQRLMVTSATYRQAARVREEARRVDPDNRLLAYYPRQRLPAEQVRDQALYVGGLLVEKLGGPSVKPYQPEGLWREVAMIQSNTRAYERGMGEDLWRRSVYTYWKRAAPPPAMLTFDAPTREFCTVRRMSTNTPLQALVLWNDEQFVEAARATAGRVMLGAEGDRDRLALLYRMCTGGTLDEGRMAALSEALAAFRERYRAGSADAASLVGVGESAAPEGLDAPELAAWTMVASAVLSSDATIVKK